MLYLPFMSIEFKKPSIEELNSYIQKELKDKPLDSLDIVRRDVTIKPIYTDVEYPSVQLSPFLSYRVNFQYFRIAPDSTTIDNLRILQALENGVSGLILDFDHKVFLADSWNTLFANIQWDYIHTELLHTEQCEGLSAYLLSKISNNAQNHLASNHFEHFSSILCIEEDDFLQNAANLIAKSQEGLGSSYLHIELSGDYFWDLCKIRAFKILFHKSLTKAANKNFFLIVGESIAFNDIVNKPQNQWLDLTTIAMSATQSGCDGFWMKNIDYQNDNADNLSQRLSRNVYNILNEESYLTDVHDPGAGSYFIENYTHAIAKAIFNRIP